MQGWKRSNIEKTDPVTNHTGETQLWYIQESQWGELVYWWYPHKINRASCIQNTQRTDIILCVQNTNKR